MSSVAPSFDEVAALVRAFTAVGSRRAITRETWLEADLGVTGLDGAELLEQAEQEFGVELVPEGSSLREMFGLGPNEYLFGPEGSDPLGVVSLLRWTQGKPPLVVVRDLKVGELYELVCPARRRRAAAV